MSIPIGRIYTTTVGGAVLKPVTCEKCGGHFVYEVQRSARGSEFSPLFLDEQGARKRSAGGAYEALAKRLNNACEIVHCPDCGRLQADMVQRLRRQHYVNAMIIASLIALAAWGIVLGSLLLAGSEHQWAGRFEHQWLRVGLLEMGLAVAAGMLLTHLLLRRTAAQLDPNAPDAKQDVFARKGIPLAELLARLARQQAGDARGGRIPPVLGSFPPQPPMPVEPAHDGSGVGILKMLLVVLVAGVITRHALPLRFDWWADPLPRDYFEVAERDFGQAQAELAAGHLDQSLAAFRRATTYASDPSEHRVQGKLLTQWCSDWRATYGRDISARADTLLLRVRNLEPDLETAGELLMEFGPQQVARSAKAALTQARAEQKSRERQRNAAATYHVRFAETQADSGNVAVEYRRQKLLEVLEKRLGAKVIAESELGEAAGVEGLGLVTIHSDALVFDIPFEEKKTDTSALGKYGYLLREKPTNVTMRLPVALRLEVRVATSRPARGSGAEMPVRSVATGATSTSATRMAVSSGSASTQPTGAWDGSHLYLALKTPPERDTTSSIRSLPDRMEAALWEQVLMSFQAGEENSPAVWERLKEKLAAAKEAQEKAKK